MKRSPIERRTPLKRGAPPERRTRLRPVSKKREKVNRARRELVAGLLAQRPRCEARDLIFVVDDKHRCNLWSCDIHEVVTRARGGSILDPDNCRAICRACHDWIHDHPKQATSIGLLASKPPNAT